MSVPTLAGTLILLSGCATLPPGVEVPETTYRISSVPNAVPRVTEPTPYDLVAEFWQPTRTRWWQIRRAEPPSMSPDALRAERGLWVHADNGNVEGLMERILSDVPVIVYLQLRPFDPEGQYPALVAGFDPERSFWLLHGVGTELERMPFAEFSRAWANAGYRWLLALPPEQATWQLTALERRSRARFWRDLGEIEAAGADFGKALSLNPDDAVHYIDLADWHLRRQEYGLSEPLYRAALLLEPNDARAMNNLAYLLIESGLGLDEGLSLARQVVLRHPENPLYLHTLARGLYGAGEYEEAIAIFQRARTQAQSHGLAPKMKARIARDLADTYTTIGSDHLARQTLRDAERLDPDRRGN